ncbi:zinc finger (MYND type) family protein / programmed cell death 2 C-terminal domain-containing protein [Zea mays]|uniref:Zinc finger (MYND type) family protein / programmed cell death 2 C-terminal domain-containing protein n=1 Tax=Zea mays TaxID=4577 RepID=B4FLK8_MAIZE|nr:unknown [Zea mays]AQK79044.1 zinc finger (MYND type) family protein / programmed cell death 2 C-terminal domain-containing protein [Zea mays]
MELPSNAGDGELLPMEEHKERALRHLLRRSKRPLEEFVAAVADVAEQLVSAYLDLGVEWRGADWRERFLASRTIARARWPGVGHTSHRVATGRAMPDQVSVVDSSEQLSSSYFNVSSIIRSTYLYLRQRYCNALSPWSLLHTIIVVH